MPPEFRLVRVASKPEQYFYIEERYWSWWPFNFGWQYRRCQRSGYRHPMIVENEARERFAGLLKEVADERAFVLFTVINVSEETVKPNNFTLADCKPLQIGWARCKFSFEAIDAQGQEVKSEVWADDEAAAQDAVRQMNLFVTKIKRLDDPDQYVVR